jgi:epoxyqueuosine reductase
MSNDPHCVAGGSKLFRKSQASPARQLQAPPGDACSPQGFWKSDQRARRNRTQRRASPFFWHPPDQHPYGDLQGVARTSSRKCPGSAEVFASAYTHPELIPVAHRNDRNVSPEQFAAEATEFALAHEAGGVGIAPMDPLYVFEGYTIDEPWVIVLALAPDYERLKEVPSDETNGVGVCEIGDAVRARNPGLLCPCQLDPFSGLQRTGLSRTLRKRAAFDSTGHCFGIGRAGQAWLTDQPAVWSRVALAGVTTDMPLVATSPIASARMSSASTCQVCTNACPPAAINEQKQMVRGIERWYVDFDKCIPFFAEAASCAICIAECPWTRPTCVQSCSQPWPDDSALGQEPAES